MEVRDGNLNYNAKADRRGEIVMRRQMYGLNVHRERRSDKTSSFARPNHVETERKYSKY